MPKPRLEIMLVGRGDEETVRLIESLTTSVEIPDVAVSVIESVAEARDRAESSAPDVLLLERSANYKGRGLDQLSVIAAETPIVMLSEEAEKGGDPAAGKIEAISIETDTGRKRLAQILSLALARRRLRLASDEARDEIASRGREATAYLACIRALLSLEDFTQIARIIFDSAKAVTGAEAGYVALLSAGETRNEVLFLDSGGLGCTVDPALPMPIRGLRAEAYKKRGPVYDNDFARSLWMEFMPPGHARLENVLFAPLVVDGKAEGLIGIANKPGGFSENDARIAGTFAELAALALKNRRDRRNAEAAWRDWENIFEAIGQSVVILSPDQTVLRANRSTAALLKKPVEDLVGKKCYELFHGTQAAPPDCPFRELRDKSFSDTVSREIHTLCGPHAVSVTPIMDPKGRPEKIIHIATSIVAIKEVIEELKESRNRYAHLIETMSSGVVVYEAAEGGEDFRVTDMNRAAEKITHVRREDVVGKKVTEIYPNVKSFGLFPILKEVYTSRKKGFLPQTNYRDERIDFWAVNHVYPLPDSRIVVVFDDITEKVLAERQKSELEAQLLQQQKLESIGILAGGVAHEINNPILGIMNYARIIEDELPPDHPHIEITKEIVAESRRIADIVQNLLKFARQDEGSQEKCSLSDIVSSTLKLIRTLLKNDQITIEADLPPELPTITCRSQRIQQVLLNLLTNARDALNVKYKGYHPDKKMSLSVLTFVKDDAPWVRITVEDRGCGIPAEIRERIFDPYFTTKPKEVGTGLGLSISHGIVREHRGNLSMECEPGESTSFHVDLPVD